MYVRDLTKILKSQCPSILLRKVTSREYFENGGTCTLRIASMTARNMLGVHSSRPETRSMNPSLPVCSPAVTPLRHALHAERGPLSSARGEAGAPGQEHVIHRAQVLILEAHLQLQKGQCQGGAAVAAESGLGRGVQRRVHRQARERSRTHRSSRECTHREAEDSAENLLRREAPAARRVNPRCRVRHSDGP